MVTRIKVGIICILDVNGPQNEQLVIEWVKYIYKLKNECISSRYMKDVQCNQDAKKLNLK